MNTISLNNKPITPSKIICIGRNYVDHIKELNNETPTQPVIFIKPNSSISSELVLDRERNRSEGKSGLKQNISLFEENSWLFDDNNGKFWSNPAFSQ